MTQPKANSAGRPALITLLAALILSAITGAARAATNDSSIKLNSLDGSTQFAVQNSNAVDVVLMNSLGGVQASSNTVLMGTTFYASGQVVMGVTVASVTIPTTASTFMTIGNSALPGISIAGASTGCGAAPTITGTNTFGTVQCVAAGAPAATAAVAVITPNRQAPVKIICSITPGNNATATLATTANKNVYITSNATTWTITSGTTGLTNGVTYLWQYVCGGY